MSAAFTPGPWEVVPYGDGDSLVIHSSDENRVCFMATHGGSANSWKTIQANAAAIAALPDLYEALRDLDKRLRECATESVSAHEAYDSFFQEIVAAALAKAEGAQ